MKKLYLILFSLFVSLSSYAYMEYIEVWMPDFIIRDLPANQFINQDEKILVFDCEVDEWAATHFTKEELINEIFIIDSSQPVPGGNNSNFIQIVNFDWEQGKTTCTISFRITGLEKKDDQKYIVFKCYEENWVWAEKGIQQRWSIETFTLTAQNTTIIPADEVTFSLSGSDDNKLYNLYRNNYYTGFRVNGTGGPINLSARVKEGSYTVRTADGYAMNGSVDVEYVAPYNDPFIIAGNLIQLNKDGGEQVINFGTSSAYTETTLRNLLSRYSTGVIGNWDDNIVLELDHFDPAFANHRMRVTNGPNLTETTQIETYIKSLSGGVADFIALVQNGYGSIIPYELTGTENGQNSISFTLAGSQHRVEYELLRNGEAIASQTGSGGPLLFETDSRYGNYTVRATYLNQRYDMQGSYTVSAPGLQKPLLSGDRNYRLTRTFIEEDGAAALDVVEYYDGMLRPIQNVIVRDPADGSVVQFYEYDRMGREDSIAYMPYVYVPSGSRPDGQFRSNALQAQSAYYREKYPYDEINGIDADRPFAQAVYDNSPLNLLLESRGVGESALTHAVAYEYGVTDGTEEIKKYTFQMGGPEIEAYELFPAGALTYRKTYQTGPGASQEQVIEYYDSQEQLIAVESRLNDEDRSFTYHFYDDLGQLRHVLQPEIQGNGGATESFYISYNPNYGTIAAMNVPGGGMTNYYYDKRGRLVLSQNSRQTVNSTGRGSEWSFVKYDINDRPIMTGVLYGGNSSTYMAQINAQTIYGETLTATGGIHGYTNNCFPFVSDANDVYSVTYYDNYDWLGATGESYAFSPEEAFVRTYSEDIIGLATGVKSKVLGQDEHQWITAVSYYDSKYRPIQTVSDLYPGGTEITSNQYSFTGDITRSRVMQNVDGVATAFDRWYDYDKYGQLVSVRQRIEGDPNGEVIISSYEYDKMGELTSKSVHNNSHATAYRNTLSGRNAAATSSVFGYRLGYDKPSIPGLDPRYDGNIGNVAWMNGDGSTGNDMGYSYGYDDRSRLTSARFMERSSSGVWSQSGRFTEDGIEYDRNGNILSVRRTDSDGNLLHSLDFTYSFMSMNRVSSVSYTDPEGTRTFAFAYDQLGNMTTDGLGGYDIEYNILNLPQRITDGQNEVRYIYDVSGRKLASIGADGSTYYRGSVVSSSTVEGSQTLSHIIHPEGFTSWSPQGYTYNYFERDHLGNVRAVLAANGPTASEVVQRTDYYPFGLAHSLSNLENNKYLYGGKEYQDYGVGRFGSLGLYDFGARYLSGRLGRWTSIDPKADSYYSLSPYSYCANNPMMFIDPDGMDVYKLLGSGEIVFVEERPGEDVLYATNEQGEIKGLPIYINTDDIIGRFYKTQEETRVTRRRGKKEENALTVGYVYGSAIDLAELFLVVTLNSNVEWTFSRFDRGNGDEYAIGTFYDSGRAPDARSMGYSPEDEIAFIHSHPAKYRNVDKELESQGYNIKKDMIDRQSDSGFKLNNPKFRNTLYYTYFPHSGNIYQVTGARPAHIRNIKNRNTNPRSLFWVH